jgi:hypothetical protein
MRPLIGDSRPPKEEWECGTAGKKLLGFLEESIEVVV